jgi:hypothetical protein
MERQTPYAGWADIPCFVFFSPIVAADRHPHEAVTPRAIFFFSSDAARITTFPQSQRVSQRDFFPSLPWYRIAVRYPARSPVMSFAR